MSALDVSVREVQAKDRKEWVRMRDALWPGSREDHEQETRAFFAEPNDEVVTFVVERPDGGLAGFLELGWRNRAEGCKHLPVAYVEGWYVDPEWRRKGLARALLEAAEGWARSHGYREIASDTWLDSDVSVRVHQALGFAIVERKICFHKNLDGPD